MLSLYCTPATNAFSINITYDYDELSRIIGVEYGNSGEKINFTYDAAGNLLKVDSSLDINVSPGDCNNDGVLDTKDIIVALQVVTMNDLADSSFAKCDVTGDNKIGLGEALYDMQRNAGAQPPAEATEATLIDFVGNWQGSGTITEGGEEQPLHISVILSVDGKSLEGFLDVGDVHPLPISGLVENETFAFELPLPVNEIGNPDCVNWNMNGTATLNDAYSIMTLTISGDACGEGGASPVLINATLTK